MNESPVNSLNVSSAATAAARGVQTPFQSEAWLRHWQRHRGPQHEPFTLVLDDGETIAPLGRMRRRGVRVLQLMGTGDSDFAGLISTREPAQAWDSVAKELARRSREWDLLHLHSVTQRAEIATALQRHLGRSGFDRIYEWCPSITISGTWDQFVARHKRMRENLKRWGKRLEERGRIQITVKPMPLSAQVLDDIEQVERASWRWDHGNAALKPGTQRDFLLGVLSDPTTPARVWLMHVGAELAAFAFVLETSTRWYYYFAVFRQDYKNAGSFLLARIVEAAHTEGCTSFSLLRGDQGYKDSWADTREAVYEIVCPVHMRGHAAAALHSFRWWAARSPHLHRVRGMLFGVGDRRKT
jgi:CelD/BcsL family acetyltransferase involved in cellulose biosynthesis